MFSFLSFIMHLKCIFESFFFFRSCSRLTITKTEEQKMSLTKWTSEHELLLPMHDVTHEKKRFFFNHFDFFLILLFLLVGFVWVALVCEAQHKLNFIQITLQWFKYNRLNWIINSIDFYGVTKWIDIHWARETLNIHWIEANQYKNTFWPRMKRKYSN